MSALDDFIANADEQVFNHTGEGKELWLTFLKLAQAVQEEIDNLTIDDIV